MLSACVLNVVWVDIDPIIFVGQIISKISSTASDIKNFQPFGRTELAAADASIFLIGLSRNELSKIVYPGGIEQSVKWVGNAFETLSDQFGKCPWGFNRNRFQSINRLS